VGGGSRSDRAALAVRRVRLPSSRRPFLAWARCYPGDSLVSLLNNSCRKPPSTDSGNRRSLPL
jgi:hypothetical protein